MPRAEPGRLRALVGLSLALVLVVLFASASIRLGAGTLQGTPLAILRGVHRASASLEVIALLALSWIAWGARRADPALARGALIAVLLTAGLSALGIAAGKEPPPLAAAGNLLGGLALGATFAWLLGCSLGRAAMDRGRMAHGVPVLVAVQCVLGAWLSIFADRLWSWPLLAHALLGAAFACGTAWLALRLPSAAARLLLLGLALALPAAGVVAVLYEPAPGAALAHAAAAALFVATAAYTYARLA